MRSVLAAVAVGAASGMGVENSQLRKVVELLQGMMAEGKKLMNEEQVLFAEQKQFCTDEIQRLEREISDDRDEQAKAEGQIAEAQAEQEELKEMIATLNGDIATAEARKAKIKKNREAEHKEFLVAEMDLEESVSALVRATAIIERQHNENKKIAQAAEEAAETPAAFLQTNKLAKHLPQKALDLLSLKAAQDPYAYESKSGGVLELLEKLQEDFKKQLHTAKMEELHRKQNWELETQRLVDIVEKSEDALSDRKESLSARKADEGKASKILVTVKDEFAADQKEHRGTSTSCHQKSKSYADKQDLRNQEFEAQQQAIDALNSVPGGGGDGAGASFLQIGREPTLQNSEVGLFLRKQATKLNSNILVQLADKIAEDPFAKVKLMIKEMVNKLQKEMQESSETKNFCDLGFSKNKKKQEKLEDKVSKLSALIDKTSGESAQLKQDVKELNAKTAATRKAMAKASAERSAENKINEQKIKDATEAQAAVSQAMQVLSDFYAGAISATAFTQLTASKQIKIGSNEWNAITGQDAAVGYDPREYHQAGEETFGENFTGQQDKSSIILGILEVVLSDFSREQTETESSEAQAVAAFDKFMQDGKVSTTKMTTTSELKAADAKEAIADLAEAKTDLKETNKEVKINQEEKSALIPMCPPELGGTKGVITFEERTEQREGELASLKQAMQLLAPRDTAL